MNTERTGLDPSAASAMARATSYASIMIGDTKIAMMPSTPGSAFTSRRAAR